MTALKLMFIIALLVSGVIGDNSKEEDEDKTNTKEEEKPDQGDTKEQEEQDKGNSKQKEIDNKQSIESNPINEETSFGDQILAMLKNAFKRIAEALTSLGK